MHYPLAVGPCRKEVKEMASVQNVGEVYKCSICGNVVEVKEVGGGELVCCGEPMELVKEDE
jgi:desulfoferrodoxin-like iron-binding protein